jgi:putative holliday junction resolvase
VNLLGLDYGEKRIGLAYADELGLAFPLPAATQGSEAGRLDAIAETVARRRVTALVVGYPYNMDGSVGFKAREVDAFIARLEARLALPVHRVDERLTTHAAQSALEEAGRKGKRDRKVRASGEVDSRAATLILQDFLDARELASPSSPLASDPNEDHDSAS